MQHGYRSGMLQVKTRLNTLFLRKFLFSKVKEAGLLAYPYHDRLPDLSVAVRSWR